MIPKYKVPHLCFMASIFEDVSMVYPSCLSDIHYSTPICFDNCWNFSTNPEFWFRGMYQGTGIEQGAKRSMATCPEAFWPNVLITFFFSSLNLPRVIMALNNCSSSGANAGRLLQSVLSNWHSNKCLLLNVKWDFWSGKEKCFFSSSMSHVYVDKKDTAWLPIVSAIQTSIIIYQASLTAKSPFITLGRINYECGISMVVSWSIPEAEWLAVTWSSCSFH